MERAFKTIALSIFFISGALPASADWRDEVGYTRLTLLAGGSLPSASSDGFTQVEAPINEAGDYQPDTTSSLYTGKSFTSKSGASAVSSHAQSVASLFYGNPTSLITGNCPVDLYETNGWLGSDFLKFPNNSLPATESRAVENHSWIATATDIPDSDAAEVNKRLDFAIDRDGFVCVVGANNGTSTTLPQLLEQSYHTISVGLVTGTHSAGFTTLDGTGRIKPDIVAPENFTSFSTPMVSSAAGLLYSKLTATPYSLTGADLPRVIKALLLASATKDTVPSWANTSSRPLDLRYGAGELNINHAYNDLIAGRATASGSTSYGPRRWAAESVASNASKTYFFTIPPAPVSTPFCAALTWHRSVSKNFFGTWSATLTDLNLQLYHASGTTLGSLMSESLSSVDNVELIHQPSLPPGDYALKVTSGSSASSTPYALAWHSLPAVTIAATGPIARQIDGQTGSVTVTRTGDTNLPLLVPLAVGGTAQSGTDFLPIPASVTIPAGSASTTLTITPVPDNLAEGQRTLSLTVAADFALVRDASQTAAVTIEDKPFDNWRFIHFTSTELATPAVSAAGADPDHDELANLLEYALNLDPQTPSLSPVAVTPSGGYLTLSVAKNPAATDIQWSAEVTDDLLSWQPAIITTNDSGNFEAHDSVPLTAADKRFIRLKIQRQ